MAPAVAAAALALTAPGAAASGSPLGSGPCAGGSLIPGQASAAAIDASIVCHIDHARLAAHLPSLAPNHLLAAVAGHQDTSMVRRDYFSDVRPSGVTPLALVSHTSYSVHTAAIAVGEIIAWGTGPDATPAHIFSAWMASPGHRAVILSGEYLEIGVAVTTAVPSVVGSHGPGATYTVEFGARRPA